MDGIHAANIELSEKVKQLEHSYNSLKNSTSLMLATMPDIQGQRPTKAKVLEESISDGATTEQNHSVLGKSIRWIVLVR